MKLAIASTTFLFAMMAVQAAVISVTSSTDVNLVKRAPNGDGETEESPTTDQPSPASTSQLPLTKEENEKIDKIYSKLYVEIFGVRNPVSDKFDEIRDLKNLMQEVEEERGEKSPSELVEVDAALAEAKEVLADLEKELEVLEAEYQKKIDIYLGIQNGTDSHNYDLLRKYLDYE
ncbi:hypothetical protein BASA50_010260 [Batrachochytrium salamandrivorans]|uniref:Uncharacterized protein n=1 Tax=Batrachochytrium salamandrivorans TaxID=1357716 RepID=A0ABQ8EYX6_9FUNG|nr:hypothetical protein BASA60_006821 [Batrachochytrium salamandrivorans]KAH6586352.1 hypothetical protein BASA61_006582 [Batrachochytrium salamandrivorans]KAH6589095.1 hypothetical protein BASA50_010260 [Batrachochytrium salamandrivorans]KAH9273322.1 hypothetical protein BASA83_004321 [Batrachochytrium salamandrivorans]